MVNGVITKKEWDAAEYLEDCLWEFKETEKYKILAKKWYETDSEEDFKKLEKAKDEYLRQKGCIK